MDLPGEIRNTIYSLLLEPSFTEVFGPTPRPYDSDLFGPFAGPVGNGRILLTARPQDQLLRPTAHYGYGRPDLKVLLLSKKVLEEAQGLFYAQHHVEVFLGIGEDNCCPSVPTGIRIDLVTDIRILLLQYECCWPFGINTRLTLNTLINAAPRLRSLRVSLRLFSRRVYEETSESLVLIGLVGSMLRAVPEHVHLIFKSWKGVEHEPSWHWTEAFWYSHTDLSMLDDIANQQFSDLMQRRNKAVAAAAVAINSDTKAAKVDE